MSWGQIEQLIDEERELREEAERRMRALAAIVRWQRNQMKSAFFAILALCPRSDTGPHGFESWYHNPDADDFMNPVDGYSETTIEAALAGIHDIRGESCETCRHYYQPAPSHPRPGAYCISSKAKVGPMTPKSFCVFNWAPKDPNGREV